MTLLVLGIMFAVIGYAMYAGVWQSLAGGIVPTLNSTSANDWSLKLAKQAEHHPYWVMFTKSHYFDFDIITFKPGHFFVR